MDNELLRVWQLVHELSEQLAHNQKMASALQSHAGALKDQALHTGTGFTLRRFNTDITKELFDSDLERMNAHTIIENQTLLHENKQLSILLKEYEGTMENIMTKFRNHALAAQQHELTLTRHYEALLVARENQGMSSDLSTATNVSLSLQRLSHHLRGLLRSMAGEYPEDHDPDLEGDASRGFDPEEFKTFLEALERETDEEGREDWALERESEIARLESENEELREMLGIDQVSIAENGIVVDPRPYPLLLPRPPRSRSGSGHGSIGMGGNDGWGRRPQSSGFMIGTGPGAGVGNSGQSQQQQQQQQQAQHILQRAMEIGQPGRMQGRRPAMFGSGQRGGIGRGGASLWGTPPPAPPMPDRPWQSQGLDLSR